jgi:hypothetical protein
MKTKGMPASEPVFTALVLGYARAREPGKNLQSSSIIENGYRRSHGEKRQEV